jgi:hypothetical protein
MKRSPGVWLLCSVVLLGAGLRLHYFKTGLRRTPDERTYTRQANVVLARGAAGFALLGAELAADPVRVSTLPSPLRVGYIVPLALFMQVTGDGSMNAGATLSLLCSLVSLVVVAWAGTRFLSISAALVATLFLSVFAFDLTVFRRTWEEAWIAMLGVVVLALAGWIAQADAAGRIRTRNAALVAFACVGFLCMTTKETSAIAFLLCAAGLAASLFLQGRKNAALLAAGSAVVAVAGYLLTLSVLFGGTIHAMALVLDYFHDSGTDVYNHQYNSGSAWMFPAALFRTSPFLFIAAIGGLGVTLRRTWRAWPKHDGVFASGVALLTASMLLLQYAGGRYDLRYAAPVFDTLCLLAGIGAAAAISPLMKVMSPLGRPIALAVIGVFLATAALRDLNFAQEHFLQPEMDDLALRPVLGVPPAPPPAEPPH